MTTQEKALSFAKSQTGRPNTANGAVFWPSDEDSADGMQKGYIAGYEDGIKLANAAPDLLEALQKCSPIIDELINQTKSGAKRNELCDLNILLKTAIQKATT